MSAARPYRGPLTQERDNIVALLRMRRECFGLTQGALGGQIGLTQWRMAEYETGRRTPNLGTLMRWAKALDCKIELCAR